MWNACTFGRNGNNCRGGDIFISFCCYKMAVQIYFGRRCARKNKISIIWWGAYEISLESGLRLYTRQFIYFSRAHILPQGLQIVLSTLIYLCRNIIGISWRIYGIYVDLTLKSRIPFIMRSFEGYRIL